MIGSMINNATCLKTVLHTNNFVMVVRIIIQFDLIDLIGMETQDIVQVSAGDSSASL